MVTFPWGNGNGNLPDLPEPDVEFVEGGTKPEDFTEAGIKGIVMNPVYAGIGKFPPLVDDKQWVAACKRVMEQDSPEQFLVNLLYLLRATFGSPGEE
jgi:hypothetical protein